jgi:hypothetical protein
MTSRDRDTEERGYDPGPEPHGDGRDTGGYDPGPEPDVDAELKDDGDSHGKED